MGNMFQPIVKYIKIYLSYVELIRNSGDFFRLAISLTVHQCLCWQCCISRSPIHWSRRRTGSCRGIFPTPTAGPWTPMTCESWWRASTNSLCSFWHCSECSAMRSEMRRVWLSTLFIALRLVFLSCLLPESCQVQFFILSSRRVMAARVSFYPCVRIYMIRILQNACSKLGVLHLPSFKDPQRASDGPKQFDSKNRVGPDTPGSRYPLSGSHVPFMGWSNPETSKTRANYDSSTSNAKKTQGMTFWTSKCFIMFRQKSCKSHKLFSSKILGNPSMLIPLGPQAGDGIDPLEEQRHLSGERQKLGNGGCLLQGGTPKIPKSVYNSNN